MSDYLATATQDATCDDCQRSVRLGDLILQGQGYIVCLGCAISKKSVPT